MEREKTVYVFKSRFKRALAAVFDRVGALVWRRRKVAPPSGPADFVVIRADHLGDVVMAEPFLRRLKSARPGSKTRFVTSALGACCMEGVGCVDGVSAFEADWFSRRPGWRRSIRSFFSFVRLLKSLPGDAVIDLRGDVRHILAARIAKPRAWIAGYGITGGSFLLDAAPRFDPRAHAAERNLRFLELLGIDRGPAPRPSPEIASRPLSGPVRTRVAGKSAPRIALHAGAGTPAKVWPAGHWTDFLRAMLAKTRAEFFFIGDAAAGARARRILAATGAEDRGRFTDFCGALPISELGSFLREVDLLVTTDSGPAHIAAAHGTPTVVLFSGTSDAEEWRPLGDSSRVLAHPVPCAPCGLTRCPLERHLCMEDLSPMRVVEETVKVLEHWNNVKCKALTLNAMKTIAFDARLVRHPGIGRYLRSLLDAMLAAKPPYAFRLIGPARDLERYAAAGATVAACEIPPYGLAEQLRMGAYFRGADLVHVPHFNAPCFGPAPNLIVTIHDLIYFHVKEYEPFPGARIALRAVLARVLSRARRVITVSEATKKDLSGRFPHVAAKCRVIHEAADPVFTAPAGPRANGAPSRVGRPYFLSVGSIREHKHAHTLLAAYEGLWAKNRTGAGIVFVGKLDSRFDRKHRFRERIQKLPCARWLGEVTDSDLGALYAGAACFVMPSLYEGFGLPVLEAMASAVPVISSDTPALAEVAGDAALQFPAGQIDRLSQLLYNILEDRELREKMIEKGKKRVSFFSWERTARETLDVYGEMLER